MNIQSAVPQLGDASRPPTLPGTEADSWAVRDTASALPSGEVHLWRAPVPEAIPAPWQTVLSTDEQERAARKRIPLDARRTLASRACLRLLLGDYLGLPPATIPLTTTAAGKPRLANRPAQTPLEFNVSHSGDWIVLAFAREVALGVDVEAERTIEFDNLVNRFFSAEERAAWQKMPPADRPRAFFSAWTRKEAYAKALGTGLSDALMRFSVGFVGAVGNISPRAPHQAGAIPWVIAPVAFGFGYACAVAVAGNMPAFRTFTFAPPGGPATVA